MEQTRCRHSARLAAALLLWSGAAPAVQIGCQGQPEGAVPACQGSGVAAWTVLDIPTSARLLPPGGTAGQALIKASGADYDAHWTDILLTEVDPVFAASPAAGIGAQDIADWAASFSWGDHALAGYLTAESDPLATAALALHQAAADPHPGYALESALGAMAYEATVQGSPSGETDPDLFASTDDAGDIEMIDAPEARDRLGLGTAATTDGSAYEPAGVTASEVANTPAGDVAATNVQSAINELDTEKLTTAQIKTAFGFSWGWDSTDLSTGTAKWSGRMPMPDGMTVTGVTCNLVTAATGSAVQIDINASGASILSTKITIDATELSSQTAATPPVISHTGLDFDELITMDIDQIGATTPGKGLKCLIIGVIPQ